MDQLDLFPTDNLGDMPSNKAYEKTRANPMRTLHGPGLPGVKCETCVFFHQYQDDRRPVDKKNKPIIHSRCRKRPLGNTISGHKHRGTHAACALYEYNQSLILEEDDM